MSSPLIQFESSRDKLAARNELRKAREIILDAYKKRSILKEKRRKNSSKWMLPELEQSLSSHRPKKKTKKHKKEKKKKKHFEKYLSDSNNDNDWVEKGCHKYSETKQLNIASAGPSKRDEWMNLSSIGATFTRDDLKRPKREFDKQKKREIERNQAPGQSSRELNPYYHAGGNGLPTSINVVQEVGYSNTTIGDSGVSWLKRAMKRAKEQATAENRSLEEVAADRWGSLENLEKLLSKAEDSFKALGSNKMNSKSEHMSNKKDFATHENRNLKSKNEKYFNSNTSRDTKVRGWKTEQRKRKDNQEQTSNIAIEKPIPENEGAPLSETELNVLGAKIIKAELMGNKILADKLRVQLETAKVKSSDSETKIQPETITKLRRKNDCSSNKTKTHDADGARLRYFPDDDKRDLKRMFESEKVNAYNDEDDYISTRRIIGGSSRSIKLDRDETIDDVFVEKLGKSRQAREDVKKAEHKLLLERRLERTLSNCRRCISGTKRHLVISIGETSYLSLPAHGHLTTDHCLISPLHHVTASTMADEDVWIEMRKFRTALIQMFMAEDKHCIVFEIAMNFKSHPHMAIQVVPVPINAGHEAPMYFQKAIQECEMEWSDNIKLIKLTPSRGLRSSVPKGLSYFHVDFTDHPGFAHVIEDERYFSKNFAQEIIAGMLEEEPFEYWKSGRKQNDESFEIQRSKVINFAKKWSNFDWTKVASSSSGSE